MCDQVWVLPPQEGQVLSTGTEVNSSCHKYIPGEPPVSKFADRGFSRWNKRKFRQ